MTQGKARAPAQTSGKKSGLDDGLTQSERFIKAAKKLGTDDDPERFADRVRALAKAPSVPHGAATKAPKRDPSE